MFVLFTITAITLLLAVFVMNWSGNGAAVVRVFLLGLGVAHLLNALKTLNPSLNWGF